MADGANQESIDEVQKKVTAVYDSLGGDSAGDKEIASDFGDYKKDTQTPQPERTQKLLDSIAEISGETNFSSEFDKVMDKVKNADPSKRDSIINDSEKQFDKAIDKFADATLRSAPGNVEKADIALEKDESKLAFESLRRSYDDTELKKEVQTAKDNGITTTVDQKRSEYQDTAQKIAAGPDLSPISPIAALAAAAQSDPTLKSALNSIAGSQNVPQDAAPPSPTPSATNVDLSTHTPSK